MEKIASIEKEAEYFCNPSKYYEYTLTPDAFKITRSINNEVLMDLKLTNSFDKGGNDSAKESCVGNIDPGFLRFENSNNKQYNLSISGLKLISKSTGKTFNVKTTRIFSSGTHYWEFHVPKSCNDISFGVIGMIEDIDHKSESSSTEEHFITFKTTTDRVVGIKLDLNKYELRSWLNGNPQPKKLLKLPESCKKFQPAIKLTTKLGKIIMLNPFARDPEEETISSKKLSNANYSVLLFKEDENAESFLKEFNEFNELIVPFEKIRIAISMIMNKSIMADIEDKEISLIMEILYTNFFDIINYLELTFGIDSDLDEISFKASNFKDYESSNEQILMFPHKVIPLGLDKTLIVLNDKKLSIVWDFENPINFIKLLTPDNSKIYFLQKDLAIFLLNTFEWRKCLRYTKSENIKLFVEALLQSKEIISGFIKLQEVDQKLLIEVLGAMKYSIKDNFPSSAKSILQLKAIFNLEAQMELKNSVCHSFSAFERLFSLYHLKDSCLNPEFLAETLIYSNNEITPSYSQIFSGENQLLNPFIEIKKLQFLNQINQNFTLNHELSILNSKIPECISNLSIPNQFIDLGNVNQILKSNNGRFIALVSLGNKQINIWNTSMIPYKVAMLDLSITDEESQDYCTPELDSSLNEYNDFNILFEGDNKSSPEIKIKREILVQPVTKIEPDLVLAEKLYTMGFDINSAKQALIQIKNKGVDEAVEWLISNPLIESEAKSIKESKIIKEKWICPICTFVNMNGFLECQVCLSHAPIDAYTDFLEDSYPETEKIEESKVNEKETSNKINGEECQVSNIKLNSLQSNISPLIASAIVKSNQTYFLRIKQIIYSQDFIYKYLSTLINGFYSTITKEWITSYKWGEIVDKILGGNSKFNLESFLPFVDELQSNILKVCKTLDYELGHQDILDYSVETDSSEVKVHLVSKSETGISLNTLKYSLNLVEFRPISFQEKIVELELDYDSKKFKAISNFNNCLYLYFDEFFVKLGKGINEKIDFKESETFYSVECLENELIVTTIQGSVKNVYRIQEKKENSGIKQQILKTDVINEMEFNLVASSPSSNCISSCQVLDNLEYSKHFFIKRGNKFEFTLGNFSQPSNVLLLNIPIENLELFKTTEIHSKQDSTISLVQNSSQLPIHVYHHEGASLSSTFIPSIILIPNKEVFVSNYPKPNFIFTHLQEKRIRLTSYTVGSSLITLNGGVLLGDGLIFVSDQIGVFKKAYEDFKDMNYTQYQEWKSKIDRRLYPWEPVSGFSLGEKDEIITVNVPSGVEGTYIFLLPTSNKPVANALNTSFESSALELTRFDIYGVTINSSSLSKHLPEDSGFKEIVKDIKVNGKIPLTSVLIDANQLQKSALIALIVEENNEFDVQGDISNILYLSASCSRLSTETIEYFTDNGKVEHLLNTIWGNMEMLKTNLLILNKLSVLKPSIINSITSKEWIKNFIDCLLLNSNSVNLIENISNLMSKFQPQILDEVLRTKLGDLRVDGITKMGLDAFFSILQETSKLYPNPQLKKIVIDELMTTINRLGEFRNHDYNKLRSYYNIEGMIFENSLFSLENLQNAKAVKSDQRLEEVSYVVSEIKEAQFKKFAIEMERPGVVELVKLYFSAKQEHDKFNIKIFGFNGYEKVLLRDYYLNDSTSFLLQEYGSQVKTPPEEQNEFITKEFNVLGIKVSGFNCQKLEIQVCLTLPLTTESKGMNLPIFPKVYVSSFTSNEIKKLQIPPRMTFIKDICFGTIEAARYESSEGSNSTFYLVTVSKENNQEKSNITFDRFEKLQSDIIEKIQDKKKVPELESQVKELIEVQALLFDSEFLKKTHLCYDFEYSLCFRLCSLLKSVFGYEFKPDSSKILEISLKIFESLVIREQGIVFREALNLLSHYLIKEMDKTSYQKFIIKVCRKFLCYANKENDISYKKIIDALFIIGVPVGELLYWLSNIIKEPVTKQRDAVILVTSLLLLINKSFPEKLVESSKEGKQSKKIEHKESTGPELIPFGVRRSQSHPIKNDFQHFDIDEYPLPCLNDDEKLTATTKITIWICQSTFPESDKVSMLLLVLSTMQKLIETSSISGLHEILSNSNDFFALILNCLKLGSGNLLEKLKEILENILEPKILAKLDENANMPQEEKLDAMGERAKYEDLKLLFISHLRILVEGAIEYALKPNGLTIYSQTIGETNTTNWIEHVSFLLDFLMLISEKFAVKNNKSSKEVKKSSKIIRKSTSNNEEGKKLKFLSIKEGEIDESKQETIKEIPIIEEEEKSSVVPNNTILQPLGINRSLSLGNQPSIPEANLRDKEGYLPLSLALSLVELLSGCSNKPNYSFENFPKVWFLVLKAVQRVKISTIIETLLFDNLVEAYLSAPEETQQTVLPELLKLTKNLVMQPNNQKETCSLVLKALFTVIDKFRLHDSLSFSLLRGLLDILLTKSTPKPEEFYTKPFDKAFCKLNKEGAIVVLDHVANFLQNYVNLGGRDGAKMASQAIVRDLILADDLLKLLTKSESSPDTLAITEIVFDLERARPAIRNLIKWYILNKTPESGDSPSTELLNSISNAVLKIFVIFTDFEDLVKICLHELISICQEIDQLVFNELTISQISNQIANVVIQRSCNVLDELLNIWVVSDAIASFVAFEVKGFDFLLDRLGLPSSEDKRFSFLESTDLELEERDSTSLQDDKKINKTTEEAQPEEFANKILLIQKPGQNFAGIQSDWSINKKGSKGRVLLFSMFQDYYSEYPLVISLEKTCEVKEIKMGFNLVSTDYANKILGAPSAVLVEGGLDLKNMAPLGVLEPISDEGYSNFSVRVYLKNFATSRGSNFNEGIKSLASKRVKFLRFRIWRPIVTFIEGSSVLYGRIYKNINVSVSFLSVIGYDVSKLPAQLKNHMIDAQKTSSLQVIGKLCNPSFNETLNILSHRPDVVFKLRNSFDHFSHLLLNHENWLSPVFLALTTNNPDLGDYLLDKLFDLNKSLPHAKLALEIMAATPEKSIERILKLHSFLIKSLYEINKHEVHIRIISLMAFIETFCSSLSLATYGIHEKIVLNVKESDIAEIINLFEEQNSNNATARTLTKLLVTLTNPPMPFKASDENLIIEYLVKIHKKSLDKPIFCEILAPMFAGNKKCAIKALENDGYLINSLIEKIEGFLNHPEEDGYNMKSLKLFFIAINSAVLCDNGIKKWVTDNGWHIKLYEAMKIKEGPSIFKDLGKDVVIAMVEFVRNVIVGSAKAEQTFADILIQDLTNLESKRDNLYVTQFLTPLLNAELYVPVCINAFDSQRKRWITEGCKSQETSKSSKRNNLQTTLETLTSKLLSSSQKESLFATLKNRYTNKNPNHKNIIKSQFHLAETQTEDGAPYLLENVHKALKQGPFIIILAGTNAGQECVCGFYSAKPLNDKIIDNTKNDYVADEVYSVPFCEDSFFFYYEESLVRIHIMSEASGNSPDTINSVASLSYFEEGGGGLSIYHKGVERIFLSFSSGNMAYVDINLLDMKPEEDENVPNDIPADFNFRQCEYWVLKTKETEKNSSASSNWSSNVLIPSWFNQNNPLNYYRPLPIYMVPATMTVDKMCQHFFTHLPELMMKVSNEKLLGDTQIYGIWEFSKKYPSTNNILDIEFDIHSVSDEKNEEGEDVRKRNLSGSVSYLPQMSVFDAFQKKEGVDKIIYVILKSLTLWKNKQKAQRWFLWIKELCFFSSLPHFFNFFIKNKESVELLFEILAGKPDDDEKQPVPVPDKVIPNPFAKKWEEEENKAIKYTYQVLSDVFKFDNDSRIREFAIDKRLLEKLLERISSISKEEPRKWVEVHEEKEEIPEIKQQESVEDNSKSGAVDDDKKAASGAAGIKKKGIGYASDNTGQNQRWNISEYYESQKSKSDQLQGLISILESFLDLDDWTPPEKLITIICTSSLLPLLESAFRSGSLLDMSKDSELYTCYLSLARTICKHKSLIPCILDLDLHYKPRQTGSIFTLLGKLKNLAEIFLHCIKDEKGEDQTSTTKLLAENIMKTYTIIEEALENYDGLDNDIDDDENDSEEAIIKEILKESTQSAYPKLLNDLRFDYMNMKDETGKFVHHYAFNITPNSIPPPSKMVRLAQELADLSTALPCEHTNSIFVRCDDSRLDVMKALIMGSAGTPYGHGAFEFEIYFDDSYPNSPPKVNLATTGTGRVRFNPNLYSCGKVCLSLLGTWRGNATENWDPKLSTLLQVLLSLQSIIMSEEVYFNEPGFEGEAGTDEGEKKNQAYSNIVKYCNIMFAMIDQIKKPSPGFEVPIKRHFYLKKVEILEEVNKWLEKAKDQEASYSGLVCDHNNSWCQEFRKTPTKFVEMMKDAITELETELNNIEPPNSKEIKKKSGMVKKGKKAKAKKVTTAAAISLDDVDMGYDEITVGKTLDIDDENVKDRWSRYIGAMGIEAVAKQANSTIFISGLGPLGIEIAKNIVLSGVKRITLYDNKKVCKSDLSGQFFVSETDCGKTRVSACISKLQQLNLYVKVDKMETDIIANEKLIEEIFSGYTLVVMSEQSYEIQASVSKFCSLKGIKFISTDTYGPFAKVFINFGQKFQVIDKNGEEPQEVMLKNITTDKNGKVEIIDGTVHDFWEGDTILLNSVKGMNSKEVEGKSINGTLHKIKVLNSKTFEIGDTTGFTDYEGSGLAKQVKMPFELNFQKFEEIMENPKLDENLKFYDFEKINNQNYAHIGFMLLDAFISKFKRLPKAWDYDDLIEFMSVIEKKLPVKTGDYTINKTFLEENLKEESALNYLRKFCLTASGCIPSLNAYLGGLVSQEIVKALTQKYTPINQLFYPDVIDLIPDLPENAFSKEYLDKIKINHSVHDRYEKLRIILGPEVIEKIQNSKIFMIGAGAIGCELLKNYSMIGLGIGSKGHITVTDPDIIEVSNLNRQFLFREKHLRKPKSSTACAAAILMNPEMKGHITARLDKVHEGTADIYTDSFFENLTAVTNALDNVPARMYIDRRCVSAHTPLLESGTLGSKGHVQVIVPYLTESYSSQKDPEEDKEIPHCTLKMFPEETLHCVEWARDLFGKYFTQKPKSLLKVLEDSSIDIQEIKLIKEAQKFAKKAPTNFSECIQIARKKFQKFFSNDIQQLMFTYPLNTKNKDGKDFWSLPKRPPTPIEFDSTKETHITCVSAISCLYAFTFNIPLPNDPRKMASKMEIAKEAINVKLEEFKPSSEKAKNMVSEIEEESKATSEKLNKIENDPDFKNESIDGKSFLQSIRDISKSKNISKISPSEFEKDNDSNFHIDFIYALANVRAENYKLDFMDWITVKLKAGKIVPALATTTACVAGLQTIELIKVIKGMKLAQYKNAFLNLAVNVMQLSEPGPVAVKIIREDLKVTIWDRWECQLNSQNEQLKSLCTNLELKYKLIVKDVFYGSKPILMSAVHKDKVKEEILKMKIKDILSLDGDEGYIDLTILFTMPDKDEIIPDTPTVRVIFEKQA